MKVPLSWLREFVPYEGTADELADRLSLTGLAVDAVLRPAQGVSGIIVAEVRSVDRHPDADKLHLVKAFDGSAERDIVCGASNYAVGDLVPLAAPGARLPDGMEIAKRKVRGEISDGMLCSAKELGLGADHSGILILDRDAEPGKDLIASLNLDDEVLDIDVLPNRPDALSILGVAREVAAIYGLKLTVPELTLRESDEDASEVVSIEVVDVDGCPRYSARIIRGATSAGTSPWWLRRRLILCGMRPIDPIVDATNHQMLEIGQPLHAFDLSTIRGAEIRVRSAHAEEEITTLDGQDRKLAEGDLLICDADRPIALAGVMGGADTEVSTSTTDLLLESATFNAMRVARTARRLDLRSEAAQRFERGVDPAIVEVANARCAALIAALTGARVSKGSALGGPGAEAPPRILVTATWISRVLGTEITADTASTILTAIGSQVESSDDSLAVTPPTWRPDIRIPPDLVEEVARLYGYDRIAQTLPEGGRIGGLPATERTRRRALAAARGAGCDEALTLSLISPEVPDRMKLPSGHPWRTMVALANPLSEEESRLRPSLIPGILEAARRNIARRASTVRLVEVGTVFSANGDQVVEDQRLTAVLTGLAADGWHAPERALDLFDARGVLDAVCGSLGVEVSVVPDEAPPPQFHPGRCGTILIHGRSVGHVAELHPDLADAMELPKRVAVLDIAIAPLVDMTTAAVAPELSKFPALDRDIALVVPATVASTHVLEVVRSSGGSLIESVDLFDRYAGEQVAAGSVSLALAIRMRAPDRTLTDDEGAAVMASVAAAAMNEGWSVRH